VCVHITVHSCLIWAVLIISALILHCSDVQHGRVKEVKKQNIFWMCMFHSSASCTAMFKFCQDMSYKCQKILWISHGWVSSSKKLLLPKTRGLNWTKLVKMVKTKMLVSWDGTKNSYNNNNKLINKAPCMPTEGCRGAGEVSVRRSGDSN